MLAVQNQADLLKHETTTFISFYILPNLLGTYTALKTSNVFLIGSEQFQNVIIILREVTIHGYINKIQRYYGK